jgi:epoxyqueuosine reductase
MTTTLETALKAQAAALGFDALGVCAADAAPHTMERLRAFLAEGRHGEMIWMEERAAQRGAPRGLWPDVRSVIMLGMSYAPPVDPLRHHNHPEIGVISVYAHGSDYHDIIKGRLKQLARWLLAEAGDGDVKVFVDTAPVMEKPLAAAAGLGWQGKHTNLVSRSHGSWLFLGAIFTTLDLATDAPHADRCGSCSACQDVCPTQAFPAPYQLDARRCLAYLTIEHKGPIPEVFRTAMGNRIYGCDDCLAVCPWNKFAAQARELRFAPRTGLDAPALTDLVQLDDAAFRARFAGTPIKRIGRDRFVRNVLYALGNSGDPAMAAHIRPHCDDPNPVVQEAARWALDQVSQSVAMRNS